MRVIQRCQLSTSLLVKVMDRDWDATTPQGLRAILERPRVKVAQACEAVEQCIAANRCACMEDSRGLYEMVDSLLPSYKFHELS